jgi:hypothetical protein
MKVLSQVNGVLTEVSGVSSSAGAGDSGKLVQLDSSGKIDASALPNNFGADALSFIASETIAAGDFVNIYNNSSVATIRKADASVATKQADGYVIAGVASGATGTVFFDDANTAVTGLTPGTTAFLSDTLPGKATATAPTGTGKVVQVLGRAVTATCIHVAIQLPITLA